MNNKGQALVEFVLILPIFIMFVFVVVDFGMIFNAKSMLENDSADILELINNDVDINEIRNLYENLTINIANENNYLKITIIEEVDLLTPGSNLVIDDPYEIKIERIIPNV